MGVTVPGIEKDTQPQHYKTRSEHDYYIALCRFSSKHFGFLSPLEPKVSKELKSAISFLRWDIKPRDVVILSRFALVFGFIALLAVNLSAFAFGYFSLIVFMFSMAIPIALAQLSTDYPKTEANLERLDSIGNAPSILTQLVIYLKQNPNLEKALEFVTKYSEGRIADDFKKALWSCLLGYKINLKEEIGKIAMRWGRYLNEFKRSLYLVRSAVVEKNEIKRNQTLDKAIQISLEGVVSKIQEYTNKLYIPTLFLFSFGTVLPLVIISLLPIFAFLGKEMSSPLQMFLLLVLSLMAIYFYSNRIISQRPAAFSTIRIPELSHYPKYGYLRFIIGKKNYDFNGLPYLTLLFIAISFPGILFLIGQIPGISLLPGFLTDLLKGFNTLTIIWATGAVIALYCYGTAVYKKGIRDEIESLEKEMVDGTYQIASRLGEGHSPEEAISFIGETMPGTKFGELMEKTDRIIKSRHATVEEAFFNSEYGTLKRVYSKNFKLIMQLFIISLKKGVQQCSSMLFTISNHFDQLKKTEEKLKETLRNSLSMMRTTAAIFAPMITGLVITLQQIMQEGLKSAQEKMSTLGTETFSLSFLKAPSLSVEMLQLISGVYMIVLAVLLIRYVTLLEYGKDEVLLRMEIAKNVPIALFIFTFTLVLSRIIL